MDKKYYTWMDKNGTRWTLVAVKVWQSPYFSCQNFSTPPTHSVVISLSPVRARS